MKFNWGHGIVLALLLFMLSMAYAVYKSMQNDYVYESKNYYQESVVYDEVLAAEQWASTLIGDTSWHRTGDEYLLNLPFVPDSASCRLKHPVKSEFDHNYKLQLASPGVRIQLNPELKMGVYWNLELTFYHEGRKGMIRRPWKY